jgi:alpha-D-xyloside xylohydrolase
MKFTQGSWWLRKGIEANYAHEWFESEQSQDALEVFAPVKPIRGRGDQLNCPVLSVRLSSPLEGVVRVQIVHFKGATQHPPAFSIQDKHPPVSIEENDEEAVFTSGRLSAHVNKAPSGWNVRFQDQSGRMLTDSGWRNMGYMRDTNTNKVYMKDELGLGVGECIYGLGEHFTPFVRNGQVIETWNDDGGTSSEISYKNISFYLSSKGYGVFVSHPEAVSFEVASEKVQRVGFSVPGERLEYYVISGPTPSEVLERYTAMTGRPALPPQWSFGLWLTTSFITDYNEKTVTGIVKGMKDRDLPLHVFHFDCFWMKGLHWIDLEWDPDVFPQPAEMLKRLKALGLKICVWINPYIAQRSKLFQEAAANGYLLKTPQGDVYQCNRWQAGLSFIDFTNPDACQWYKTLLGKLVDMGVDSFKTDFGEEIPTDVVYHDQSDPIKMHNYYTYLYNKVVFEVLREKLGEHEAVLFARSATAGGQQFPVHWGGDCSATFESMAESLRGGLSLGLSGFGFWSHDMGGFQNTASPDVYKRWIAFGCLSSHSRLHGSESYRVPWLYDEESVDVLRYFTKLKCRLMPYLFQKAVEAHSHGVPVMRAMCLEFPHDPGCRYLDRQYMLGETLMVAPVFDTNGEVEYFLPDGEWIDFITGEKKQGGRWYQEQYDYMSLPLLARENSIIPMGKQDRIPDYTLSEDITLHIFALQKGCTKTIRIPDHTGESASIFRCQRTENQITMTPEKVSGTWRVLLRDKQDVIGIKGGKATDHEIGTIITPDSRTTALCIQIG